MSEDPEYWQDDPWGEADDGIRRRWRRWWNVYLAYLLGFLGPLILVSGIVARHGPAILGGGLITASACCFVRSDGPRWAKGPRPPPPSPTYELGWVAAAVFLLVLGVVLSL
jgi:hypothetical protein